MKCPTKALRGLGVEVRGPRPLCFVAVPDLSLQHSTTINHKAPNKNTIASVTSRAKRPTSDPHALPDRSRRTAAAMELRLMPCRRKAKTTVQRWSNTTSKPPSSYSGKTTPRAECPLTRLIYMASLSRRPKTSWKSVFDMRNRMARHISVSLSAKATTALGTCKRSNRESRRSVESSGYSIKPNPTRAASWSI